MNAIEAHNLTKLYRLYKSTRGRVLEMLSFGRKNCHREFYALRGVSFAVERGRTIGIIGQNGSGKSTLLKILSGVVRPTSGKLNTQGRIASLLELGAGFSPEFTGRENVYMNGALLGLSHDQIEERFPDIEAFAEIGEFIDQPVKHYSSGMYVRLAFAAAINVNAEILIIDEALAVGDAMFQHRCWNKIGELKKDKTILLASHDMNAILNVCDEVIWLKDGLVEEINDPKTVSEHYLAYVYGTGKEKQGSPQTPQREDLVLPDESAARDQQRPSRSRSVVRFGNGMAKVLSLKITDDDGKELSTLTPVIPVKVSVGVECVESIEMPIVGITIRDRRGAAVIVTNTRNEGLSLPSLSPSERLEVTFCFCWPRLVKGSYSFSPAVAAGTRESFVVCDWIYDYSILESHGMASTLGIVEPDSMRVTYDTL